VLSCTSKHQLSRLLENGILPDHCKRPNLTVWTELVVMSYAAGEEPVTEAPQYSLTIEWN
jgi:hypothetical protein